MKSYVVQLGDSFDSISLDQYQAPSFAELLRLANPHTDGGLVPAATITIPDKTFGLEEIRQAGIGEPGEVTLKIDGRVFRFWDSVELTQSVDSFDRIALGGPFEATSPIFREAFQPFKFKPAEMYIGEKLFFTGTLVGVTPVLALAKSTVTAEGYARAGVLSDSDMPIPQRRGHQYRGLKLDGLATRLCEPFGLEPVFQVDSETLGPELRKVAIDPTSKVSAFFNRLARQRGIIISNTDLGHPLFWTAPEADAVESLEENVSPLLGVSPRFRPQQYYSSITAITPGKSGRGRGARHTEENPHLRGVLRPMNFKADDTYGADNVAAAKSKMGRMFANAMSWDVGVAGWNRRSGDAWEKGDHVELLAPSSFIYTRTKFLIREVTLRGAIDSQVSKLNVVFPGSFSGKIPAVLPWTGVTG